MKKSKKSKKLSPAQLKRKIDAKFAERVRARGVCARCGKTFNLQCAHIYSRSHMSTRWDPDNALCMCLRCHLYWAHRYPLEFTEWVREVWLGENNYQILRAKAYSIKQWERWELEELLEKV